MLNKVRLVYNFQANRRLHSWLKQYLAQPITPRQLQAGEYMGLHVALNPFQ